MKSPFLLLPLLTVFVLPAMGQGPVVVVDPAGGAIEPVAPDPFMAQYEATFETPAMYDTTRFIPQVYMSGALHTVAPKTWNDGLNNTYLLITGNNRVEITTTHFLITRINELYAINYLEGQSKTDAFTNALVNAGKGKINSAVAIIENPVGTLENIPKGASRFFGRIGEGLKGGKSNTQDTMLQGMLGVSKAKMALAVQLGVSPYSDNVVLQDELNQFARAIAGGGLVVNLGTAAVGGTFGGVLTGLNVNQTLQSTLVNSSPDDLRIVNRKKLFALGLTRSEADAFLMHPWFTPWEATIIVDALANIGVSPRAFLAQACGALTPEDAWYFQRVAQILLSYHLTAAPLTSIQMENGIVCGVDANGILVVAVSLDYGIWAERTARRAQEFQTLLASRPDLKGAALWVDGLMSDTLCDQLSKRNITWKILALSGELNANP